MITEIKNPSWDELLKMKDGTILRDWFDEGIRCIIMRALASLTAYLGIPIDHPLAGFNYDDMPIDCHAGLTFGGSNKFFPKGYYWYGWDYAHSGDYCFYHDLPPIKGKFDHSDDKKWLVEDVEKDMWSAIYDFKKLIKIAERIAAKSK